MTWNAPLEKAPESDLEPWKSNLEIQKKWESHVSRRGAKNTQRNLITYCRPFFNAFAEPVTNLNSQDAQNFVEKISKKCSKLMNGAKPQCLAGEAIDTCPLLKGGREFSTCPSYQSLQPSGTWSYICAVNRLYEWLREEQQVSTNPMLPVMRDFAKLHEPFFRERRRKPKRRHLTTDEVRTLVQNSPIQHGTAYLLMAKCFLRVHEVLKLTWDPEYCNLAEGWIDIPSNSELGDKRKGNPRIMLDAELRNWLSVYQKWWDGKVRRAPDGNPQTNRLVITTHGMPWAADYAVNNFNDALKKNAVRLALMPNGSCPREQRVNSHCFRAYATTAARKNGAGNSDLQILRGDLNPGSLIRYDDYLSRLPEIHRNFAPVIGV